MSTPDNDDRDVVRMIARLHAGVLAVVGALVGGAGLFVITAWLLVKGGPNVGVHLQLLGQYFPGYAVTWPGCFAGLFYGALLGAAVGWCIGAVYNLVVGLRE